MPYPHSFLIHFDPILCPTRPRPAALDAFLQSSNRLQSYRTCLSLAQFKYSKLKLQIAHSVGQSFTYSSWLPPDILNTIKFIPSSKSLFLKRLYTSCLGNGVTLHFYCSHSVYQLLARNLSFFHCLHAFQSTL